MKLLDNERFCENIGIFELLGNGSGQIIVNTIEERDALDLTDVEQYSLVYVSDPYPGTTWRLIDKTTSPPTWREESGSGGSGSLTKDDILVIIEGEGYAKTTYVDTQDTALETELDNKVDKNLIDNKLYARRNNIWEEITIPTINLTNYYTKTETDTLLATKVEEAPEDSKAYNRKDGVWVEAVSSTVDLTNYYTKTEINTFISNKSSSKVTSGYYEVDASTNKDIFKRRFGFTTAADDSTLTTIALGETPTAIISINGYIKSGTVMYPLFYNDVEAIIFFNVYIDGSNLNIKSIGLNSLPGEVTIEYIL